MYCLSTCLFICRHAKHGSVFDLATIVKPMFWVNSYSDRYLVISVLNIQK